MRAHTTTTTMDKKNLKERENNTKYLLLDAFTVRDPSVFKEWCSPRTLYLYRRCAFECYTFSCRKFGEFIYNLLVKHFGKWKVPIILNIRQMHLQTQLIDSQNIYNLHIGMLLYDSWHQHGSSFISLSSFCRGALSFGKAIRF